jgi:tetratricopeptide (TPR) repeat protein
MHERPCSQVTHGIPRFKNFASTREPPVSTCDEALDVSTRHRPPSESLLAMDADVRFSDLWAAGIRGEDVTVAILDTGVNPSPDLLGRVVVNCDFTGADEPHGGTQWHATSMARAAALIAPRARIANLRVFPKLADANRQTIGPAIRRALDYCIDLPGPVVANVSVNLIPRNCPDDCDICAAVDDAARHNVAVVVSAGNRGQPRMDCPAAAPLAINVVAEGDELWAGWWKTLGRARRWWWLATGRIGRFVGTSFAAAYASGTVALLRSAVPTATPVEIKKALIAGITGPYKGGPITTSLRILACMTGVAPDGGLPAFDEDTLTPTALARAYGMYSLRKAELADVAPWMAASEAEPLPPNLVFVGQLGVIDPSGLVPEARAFVRDWLVNELHAYSEAVRELRELQSYFGTQPHPDIAADIDEYVAKLDEDPALGREELITGKQRTVAVKDAYLSHIPPITAFLDIDAGDEYALELGRYLERHGRLDDARVVYTAAGAHIKSGHVRTRASIALAKVLLQLGRVEEAGVLLGQLATKDPSSSRDAEYVLAKADFDMKTNESASAEAALKALRAAADNGDVRDRAVLALSELYVRNGRSDEALLLLEPLTKSDNMFVAAFARYNRGVLLKQQGKDAAAIDEVRRAVSVRGPLQYRAALFLGEMHEGQGALEEANKWLSRACRSSEPVVASRSHLKAGGVAIALGKSAEAVNHFQRVIKIGVPDDAAQAAATLKELAAAD